MSCLSIFSVNSANETGKFQTKVNNRVSNRPLFGLIIFISQKFYLEYRTAVGYAKKDPSSNNPIFKSLEEWEPVKSTKMDVCARICRHYLQQDDVPDVEFQDGQVIFPTLAQKPGEPGETASRTRKILIYAEFPSMTGILQNVCLTRF